MSGISENLGCVIDRVTAACLRVTRDPGSVQTIAVSKTYPAELLRLAFESGQKSFGESRIQEAEPKILELPDSLQWHFIGRVQRNKVRKILRHFAVIHAIDSLRLAAYCNEVAEEMEVFPKVFLQVNVGDESSKGGFSLDELRADFKAISNLGQLEVMGLMCIPPAGPDAESSRRWFVMLREIRDALETEFGIKLPALSMGMSGDFEVAIEEGATHVRVGSAIFGKRLYRVDGELG